MNSVEARRRVRAIIVGRESHPQTHHQLASQLGLGERVQFLSPIPEVERFYHALDICVHPARYEEFGMCVLEMMACGVPVLTSARVGAAELLTGEARETVLETPQVELIAAQLEALVRDEAMRRRWGEYARQACQPCTWDAHFRGVWACLESLLR